MHIPVLLNETIELLAPKPNENFIDCTFGFGGHSLAILEKNLPCGRVLGIEWDRQSYEVLPVSIFKNDRLVVVNGSYADVGSIARENGFTSVDGMLFDLGISSWHIDKSKKGFSFSKDEELDMRFDHVNPLTAAQIINDWPPADLEKIFADYGQERAAKKIAMAVSRARSQRPILTTGHLAAIVEKNSGPGPAAPSTARIFQALRIAVNHEFENIGQGIDRGFAILKEGGRMAVITFHSLEDRIVKNKFRGLVAASTAELVNKKPIVPGVREVQENPRSRSAKLRVIKKINRPAD